MLPDRIDVPPVSLLTRQVSVGSLLSRALATWGRNLFRFVAVAVILALPAGLLGFGISAALARIGAAANQGSWVRGLAAFGEDGLLAMTTATFLMVAAAAQFGAVTHGVGQHLAGRPVSIGGMLVAGVSRLFQLLGLGMMLLVCAAGVWLCLAFLVEHLGWVAGPVSIVAFLASVLFACCALAVSAPALVAERIGPIRSLRRSWVLTKDHRASIFLAGVIWWLVLSGIYIAAGTVTIGVLSRMPLVGGPLFAAIVLLETSLACVFPAVLYHDLRAHKEGPSAADLVGVFE